MSGSIRQFEKSRAEIPDAASTKRLHQNPQHQPQQPPRKRERQGQQTRYRLQTDIEAQICAEQKHRKAIECHRKETPQRALSQQRCKSLGAKTGNRQSATTAMPATRIAVPDTRQRGNPTPHQGQKVESTPRDTKPLPRPIRAHRIPID